MDLVGIKVRLYGRVYVNAMIYDSFSKEKFTLRINSPTFIPTEVPSGSPCGGFYSISVCIHVCLRVTVITDSHPHIFSDFALSTMWTANCMLIEFII